MRELPTEFQEKRAAALGFAVDNDHDNARNALVEAGAFVYDGPSAFGKVALGQLVLDTARIDMRFGAEPATGKRGDYLGIIAARLSGLGHNFGPGAPELNGQTGVAGLLRADALCLSGILQLMQSLKSDKPLISFIEQSFALAGEAKDILAGPNPPLLSYQILRSQLQRIEYGRVNSMHESYFRGVTQVLLEDELAKARSSSQANRYGHTGADANGVKAVELLERLTSTVGEKTQKA